MDERRNYHRAAENYFQALLRSRRNERDVAQELEATATYLNDEGQMELAEALHEVIIRRLAPDAEHPFRGSSRGSRS